MVLKEHTAVSPVFESLKLLRSHTFQLFMAVTFLSSMLQVYMCSFGNLHIADMS